MTMSNTIIEMKTVDGKTMKVVGSTTMTHRRTYRQKWFLVVVKENGNGRRMMNVSEFVGMTQKKAAMLNHKGLFFVDIPPYIDKDFV